MMSRFALLLTGIVAIAGTVAVTPQPLTLPTVVTVMQTGDTSMFVATATGGTLYTFDKDPSGVATCTSKALQKRAPICSEIWPPLEAVIGNTTIGPFTVVKRDDGLLQWAYDGKPLYLYSKDQVPLEAHGDGVDKLWHIARP